MYSRYFGLEEEPFSIAPNPRYLFMSEQHREALGHLLYGVGVGGGFVLLTGEVGTGKTTICRSLLEQLPEATDIAFILNPYLDAKELLASICDELEIEYESHARNLRALSMALYKFLLRNHARGRNTVLLIDEAQNLDPKILELIRLLTNLETDSKKLLQIIFIGQPELNEMLARPELRQLAQRITARFHIEPLNLKETQAYIRHRLHIAGLPVSQELFAPGIVKYVFRRSGGVPRLINVLCDRMLLGTYAQNKTMVDKATLDKAAEEVLGKELPKDSHRVWWPATAAAAVLLTLAGLGFWFWPGAANDTIAESGVSAGTTPVVEPSIRAAKVPAYASESAALNDLLVSLDLPHLTGPSPCEGSKDNGWQCLRLAAKNWKNFIDINRPAVLRLLDEQQRSSFIVLAGLRGTNAEVLFEGKKTTHSLIELGQHWTGEYAFVWQGPHSFEKPFAKGDSGEVVGWLARRFAQLDGQETGLAEQDFNEALSQRVILFQEEQGLDDDGIVGVRTLLKLNERLGLALTLEQGLPANVASGEG